MIASTIPACKAAVLAILTARGALTGVTLTWAGPTKDEDFTGEMIFLGQATSNENWGSLGAGMRRETYQLTITVWVEQWGDDPQAAEVRAFALWAEVMEGLTVDVRSQPSTLRTAGVRQFDQSSFSMVTGPASPEKWGARVDAQVTFTADLLP